MEPIVLMGLIIVIYGGYVSITDWLQGLSGMIKLKRRAVKTAGQKERLKPFARQMVRMYV